MQITVHRRSMDKAYCIDTLTPTVLLFTHLFPHVYHQQPPPDKYGRASRPPVFRCAFTYRIDILSFDGQPRFSPFPSARNIQISRQYRTELTRAINARPARYAMRRAENQKKKKERKRTTFAAYTHLLSTTTSESIPRCRMP